MVADRTKTLLLVEDDFIISWATTRRLQSRGYRVLSAPTGEQGLELFSRDDSVDLVLMDIDLGPGRLSGMETAAAMVRTRAVPIIFLTACPRWWIERKVSGLPLWGYVSKVAPDNLLFEGVSKILGEDRSA